MDNFATQCPSEMIKAPCSARKSSKNCDWITLTQVNEVIVIMMSIISIITNNNNNYYHNYLK